MITVEDVEHVAKLARLRLSADEKKLYTEQLGKIIDFFAELNAIDTTGVEPMSHALSVTNVMREDEVETPPGHEILLKSAPDRDDAFFRVPKIGD
ncbi:MAG: Asp-tRNA(Asn)/Glu-tRNA(Gln) amidotransferase subunit GatC [Cyanobacteria bacterium SZAS-4]|nr:Asp-tRNA(Asn)/Glu-tRNA(Gln) amidotransferase subunit GatC [Cyanobacteria bacterium SZAS-4]